MSRFIGPSGDSTYAMLFSRTMTVLLTMIGLSYVGSMLTWDWIPSAGQFIALIALWFAALFGTMFVSGKANNNPIAIVPAAIFSFIGGAITGPTLAMYTETLGTGQVSFALSLCGAVLVICAGVSYVINFAYAKLEAFLMFALLGLIGYHIVTIFTGLNAALDLTVSFIGAGIFTVFLLVDFMRLKSEAKQGNTGWGMAVSLAVNMYLDLLNLLLYILRIMGYANDD